MGVAGIRKLAAIIVTTVGLMLAGCGGERFQWNQKLTITVETPSGEVSRSSVASVRLVEGSNLNTGWGAALQAEAVVIPLPTGKYLFAIQRRDDFIGYRQPDHLWPASVASATISGKRGRILQRDLIAEVSSKTGRAAGVLLVPRADYPLLVTFRNIDDPKSVVEVDPDNLAAAFGSGNRLKSVTVEVTGDEPTVGEVIKVLPWLATVKPGNFADSPFSKADDNLLDKLGPGEFFGKVEG